MQNSSIPETFIDFSGGKWSKCRSICNAGHIIINEIGYNVHLAKRENVTKLALYIVIFSLLEGNMSTETLNRVSKHYSVLSTKQNS